ncbi:MAG TPA: hypothetical protein VLE47_01880 [Candidatus Saccharimonadales bacterium]|nr:hypothetical protein [Candidatus Saccharimonadales bacterium]
MPTIASAHVLKTDGSIGAVVHIDPDDDPIIGKSANFFLEFKDTKNKFQLANCSCTYSIKKADSEVSSGALSPSTDSSPNSAVLSYTFPEKGVYQLVVNGASTNNSFADFNLSYDLRISRQEGQTTKNNFFLQNLHFIILGIIILVFVAIVLAPKIKGFLKGLNEN